MNDRELNLAYEYQNDRYYAQIQQQAYWSEQKERSDLSLFSEQIKIQNSPELYRLSEHLAEDDLFWLAIGSGDYSIVEQIKQQKILHIVINNHYYQEQDDDN